MPGRHQQGRQGGGSQLSNTCISSSSSSSPWNQPPKCPTKNICISHSINLESTLVGFNLAAPFSHLLGGRGLRSLSRHIALGASSQPCVGWRHCHSISCMGPHSWGAHCPSVEQLSGPSLAPPHIVLPAAWFSVLLLRGSVYCQHKRQGACGACCSWAGHGCVSPAMAPMLLLSSSGTTQPPLQQHQTAAWVSSNSQ